MTYEEGLDYFDKIVEQKRRKMVSKYTTTDLLSDTPCPEKEEFISFCRVRTLARMFLILQKDGIIPKEHRITD